MRQGNVAPCYRRVRNHGPLLPVFCALCPVLHRETRLTTPLHRRPPNVERAVACARAGRALEPSLLWWDFVEGNALEIMGTC
jgi:hypothetical protein